MTDYPGLKIEDANPKYSAMTDVQRCTSMNTTQTDVEQATDGASVGRLWARRQILATARERSQRTTLTAPQRVTAWSAIEMVINDGFSGINPANTVARNGLIAFLDSLIADNIMTAQDKADTMALLLPSRTVAQTLGFTNGVSPSDLVAARAFP